VAEIVTVPFKPALGVYVTVQLPEAERAQLAAGVKVPEDAGLWARVTVPVGTTAVPGEVSVTVIVQLVAVPGEVLDGVHTTAVEVDLWTATICIVGEVLPE
jgi:hypothetical protein